MRPYAAMLVATLIAGGALAQAPKADPALVKAIAAPTRTPTNVLRDKYRHPGQTLAFFGVKPTQTVVEIWPSGGWYTEILAPYLSAKGQYWAAGPWPKGVDGVKKLAAKDAALYGKIHYAGFPAGAEGAPSVPAGAADVVLTFRNVHNWQMGQRDFAADAFKQMFAMLKPGGVLGVVEHRLPETASAEREAKSGYVKVSTVKRLAQEAGFAFEAASEVNANPKDTADWPEGVWTLPPVYALKDVDRAKYAAIGESDRMTLRFRKPK
jgi:predicted methyltransferase